MQFGLAWKPATAYFLKQPERAWLAERQTHERAVKGAQSASSGNMWGGHHAMLSPHSLDCAL